MIINFIEKKSLASMLEYAKTYIGVPYLRGGTDRSGIDCSHFVCELMKKIGVVSNDFFHTANGLFNRKVCSRELLLEQVKEGDFMFWGNQKKKIHIALVVGCNNDEIHIIDASGKDSGEGKVAFRKVKYDISKHYFKRPDIY